jgi:oligoendopeptidase F
LPFFAIDGEDIISGERTYGVKQITWNFGKLFSGDNDPAIEKKRQSLEKKSHAFINKWHDRSDYLRAPAILKQALDEYELWRRQYGSEGDEGYYFWLRTTQNQNDPKLKAKFNTIDNFSKKIENDIQFFPLRIAKIPPKKQGQFLRYPPLNAYRHYLERIFAESKYLLGEPEEKILNLKSTTSHSNWVKMTSGFLAGEERRIVLENGEKEKKSFSEIQSLMNSKKRRVRDAAADAFNDILSKHADAAEAELNSVLANKKVDDELRNVSRPDLMRHVTDDIDSEVVDALIKTVSERFGISCRYYRLKTRLLKVKRLKYHERNREYGTINTSYPYPQAVRLVRTVFQNLDDSFSSILDRFIGNGQFDVYPRKGKVSGAFCAHLLMSQPTYILLNHTGRLNDVLTLAHEMGHGINNELIREKQNALNFGTPISTAEVASTFMEDFVLQEIMKKADDELRLSIMMMRLNDEVSTIFRQIACYRFEQELHQQFRQKGYLSKEEIGRLFQKHMAAYMGDAVERSPGSENWWVYWSHIRSFFYVYSYASGLLISKSLQHSVKKDPKFIGKVRNFLSAGLSDSPKNIFARLGVDISDEQFWNKGLDEVEKLLNETTTLAKKLGKFR